MKNSMPKGTGDSRYLKSIPDFLKVYPEYQNFGAALAAGTIPVDFNGINPQGWEQIGTKLNKADLLSDLTAHLMGLSIEATMDEAFRRLYDVIGIYDGDNSEAVNQ